MVDLEKDWNERLIDFVQTMAAKGHLSADQTAHFSVVLATAKKGLHIPEVVRILRDTIYRLTTVSQEPVIQEYLKKILLDFENEILVGEVAVEILREITEGE
jgi:hypothetical protein